MIEPIMYVGIGFLIAALVGLAVVPLVHSRAVRLTILRLEAATPLSMVAIQADKDQLRAEFAMSTRRLEMSVESLRAKSTSHFAELGKKNDVINRFKKELSEKTATLHALKKGDKAAWNRLRTTKEDSSVDTDPSQQVENALLLERINDVAAEVARLASALEADPASGDLSGRMRALQAHKA